MCCGDREIQKLMDSPIYRDVVFLFTVSDSYKCVSMYIFALHYY